MKDSVGMPSTGSGARSSTRCPVQGWDPTGLSRSSIEATVVPSRMPSATRTRPISPPVGQAPLWQSRTYPRVLRTAPARLPRGASPAAPSGTRLSFKPPRGRSSGA